MSADHDSSSTRPQVTSEEEARFFALLSDADRHRIWERLMARPAREKAPPAPLTDFDRTFQEIAGPRLEGYVRLGAILVSQTLESFSEAHDRVMRVARQRGAGHLSDAAFLALEAWVDQQLLREIS